MTEALIGDLAFERENLEKAIDPSMLATDRAIELAAQGVPFRDAYRRVGEEVAQQVAQQGASSVDAQDSLRARVSLGGTGNLGLEIMWKRLEGLASGS